MARDSENNVPHHIASRYGQMKVVQYSIEKINIDPNTTGYNQGLHLHDACERGHLYIIKYLVEVYK